MQDYIREQPDRTDRNDGITVLVEYLAALERFFPAAITFPRPDEIDERQETDTRERDLAVFYHDVVINHTAITLDTIADIADGPNQKNQAKMADGPLLEGINKLLDSIQLHDTPMFERVEGMFKVVQPFDYTAIRATEHIRVLDQLIFMLRALLEGPPTLAVHTRILNCVKWSAYATQLLDMYAVLVTSGLGHRSLRRFNDRAVHMWAVVQELMESTVLEDDMATRKLLHPVLQYADMVEYFMSQTCCVEIQKDIGKTRTLEKLYFPKPALYVVTHRHIQKTLGREILNKCPLDDDENKLSVFMELCLERAVETTVVETAFYWGEGLT
eukprot:SAG31_NODE_10970_length_1077_cov_1.502045_1_plen_327_part_01